MKFSLILHSREDHNREPNVGDCVYPPGLSGTQPLHLSVRRRMRVGQDVARPVLKLKYLNLQAREGNSLVGDYSGDLIWRVELQGRSECSGQSNLLDQS